MMVQCQYHEASQNKSGVPGVSLEDYVLSLLMFAQLKRTPHDLPPLDFRFPRYVRRGRDHSPAAVRRRGKPVPRGTGHGAAGVDDVRRRKDGASRRCASQWRSRWTDPTFFDVFILFLHQNNGRTRHQHTCDSCDVCV